MNVLHIDTSSNKEITVTIQSNEKKDEIRQKITFQKAQVVLPLIDKLLKRNKLKLVNLNAVEVNVGPGSFTGLRVGIAIANSLSYGLKIPVNGNSPGIFVVPTYQ